MVLVATLEGLEVSAVVRVFGTGDGEKQRSGCGEFE